MLGKLEEGCAPVLTDISFAGQLRRRPARP
jgi:hypothetical protein